jgi:aldose 1-epimerase
MSGQPEGATPDGPGAGAIFTLAAGGIEVGLASVGAAITRIVAADRLGRRADVVLGPPGIDGYRSNPAYMGVVVGRVAGRITPPYFDVEGRHYALEANNGPHHLHGGSCGFGRRTWSTEGVAPGGRSIRFRLHSPDGEEGYPGSVVVGVTYTLDGHGGLEISYEATADRPTPLSLTNHAYFNLAGESSGDVTGHLLQVKSDLYCPVTDAMAHTGAVEAVVAGANDFRSPALLCERLGRMHAAHGDLYYLGARATQPRPCARLMDPASGRWMAVSTTEPFLQVYTGSGLDGTLAGKSGRPYGRFAGLCLECEGHPGAVHRPFLDTLLVGPGRPYRQVTVYRFGASVEARLPEPWLA